MAEDEMAAAERWRFTLASRLRRWRHYRVYALLCYMPLSAPDGCRHEYLHMPLPSELHYGDTLCYCYCLPRFTVYADDAYLLIILH